MKLFLQYFQSIKTLKRNNMCVRFVQRYASLQGTWAEIIGYASYFSKILTCLEYFLGTGSYSSGKPPVSRGGSWEGGVRWVELIMLLTWLHYPAMQALSSWVHTFLNRVCGWFIKAIQVRQSEYFIFYYLFKISEEIQGNYELEIFISDLHSNMWI